MSRSSRSTLGAVLLGLLAPGLSGCVSLGRELTPRVRPAPEGFAVTLHAKGADRYQLAVWQPAGHPYAFGCGLPPPWATLLGDAQVPATVSKEDVKEVAESVGARLELHLGTRGALDVELVQEPDIRREYRGVQAVTTWEFDRARWASGRPFTLALRRGLTGDRRLVLEIGLGPTVGASDGLTARVASQDPWPPAGEPHRVPEVCQPAPIP